MTSYYLQSSQYLEEEKNLRLRRDDSLYFFEVLEVEEKEKLQECLIGILFLHNSPCSF